MIEVIEMNYFIALSAKKIKRTLFIVTLAFFTAWFLFIQFSTDSPVFSTKDGPKAVYRGEQNVALTFNIGWGDEKAETILNELKENNVKDATFFISGSWAERHPHLVEKMQEQKYEIGLLGYNYVDYAHAENSEITKDIIKGQEAFRKLGLKDVKYLRSPTGHFDKRLLDISERYGYTIVHWSVDSKDWTNPGVNKIINNIKQVKDGDILLFHASDSAQQTAAAIPDILQIISDRNLKMVTVSELLSNSSVKTEEIE